VSTTEQTTLEIDGMHCDHCVEAVRDALETVRDLEVHRVEIGTAEVTYDPSDLSTDQLATILDDAGYELVSA
jgi:copper chaperone